MRQLTPIDVPAVVRAYPWPRRGVICDVAGGIGPQVAAILERRRRLAASSLMRLRSSRRPKASYARARGPTESSAARATLFGDLGARADVYAMKWILHDWSDDAVSRDTRPRAGHDVVRLEARNDRPAPRAGRPNPLAPMTDALMLVMCEGGRERSPQEVHGLMHDSGLKLGCIRHAGLTMLVEGVAPWHPDHQSLTLLH